MLFGSWIRIIESLIDFVGCRGGEFSGVFIFFLVFFWLLSEKVSFKVWTGVEGYKRDKRK